MAPTENVALRAKVAQLKARVAFLEHEVERQMKWKTEAQGERDALVRKNGMLEDTSSAVVKQLLVLASEVKTFGADAAYFRMAALRIVALEDAVDRIIRAARQKPINSKALADALIVLMATRAER